MGEIFYSIIGLNALYIPVANQLKSVTLGLHEKLRPLGGIVGMFTDIV